MKTVLKNYSGEMSSLNYIIDREKIKKLTGVKREKDNLVENVDVEAYLDWFSILSDVQQCQDANELLAIGDTPVLGVYSRQVCHDIDMAVDQKIEELLKKEDK